MKEPVTAQKLTEMLSHAIPQRVIPLSECRNYYGYMAPIYGIMADFGKNVLSIKEGKPIMGGDPSKTPESLRQDMLSLQHLVIELSNVGFVNQAREFAISIEYMERNFGQFYLEMKATG